MDWLSQKEQWAGLKTIVMIEETQESNGKISTERRFFISSLPADAKRIADAVRSHWLIESAPQAHKVGIKGIISKCSKAVGKMMVGPSKSAVRSRFETTPSGCH